MIEIYFHVGPPKTGSSTIQRFFKETADANTKSGVYFPPSFKGLGGVNYNLSVDIENDLEHLRGALDHCRAIGANKLVLSSEWGVSQLSELSKTGAGMIRDLLESYGAHLRIVLCYRNGTSMRLSQYNQMLINKSENNLLFEDFDRTSRPLPSMGDIISRISDAVHMLDAASLTVVMFNRHWAKTVLSHLGLGGTECMTQGVNRRLPDVYVEIVRQWNLSKERKEKGLHFFNVLNRVVEREGFEFSSIVKRRAARFGPGSPKLDDKSFDHFRFIENPPLRYNELEFSSAISKLRSALSED